MAIGNPITLTSNVASKTISAIATAGQTLFTVTGGYRINQLAVFRNGVRLLDSRDYEARNGSTVTLLSAATVGDALEFQVFDDFRVADAIVSAESEQTIQGNLTVAGILTATDLSVTDLSLRHLEATGISTVSNTTQSTTTTSGALIVSGGLGVAKNLFVGGSMNVAGTLTYEDVTNSETSGVTTTGGLVVTGLGATFGSISTHFSNVEFGAAGVGGTITPLGHAGFTGIVTALGFQASGVVTATSFRGDGSQLSGVDSSNLIDSGDTNRVAANTSGIVVTGISTLNGNVFVRASSDPTIQIQSTDSSISADQVIGSIEFKANDGSNDGDQVTGSIESVAQAAFTGQGSPSHLIFSTNGPSGAGALGERLRITHDGKVGINSTTPGALFTVNTGGTEDAFRVGSPNGSDTIIRLGSTGTDTDTHAVIKYDKDDNYLSLLVSGESHGVGGVLIANGGNVGLGSAIPAQALDVQSGSNQTARIQAHGFIARNNWGTHTSIGNGMFSPATNALAFATNSNERLQIDSSGNIVIKNSTSGGLYLKGIDGNGDEKILIGYESGTIVRIAESLRMDFGTTSLEPVTDNSVDLGQADRRWKNIYSADLQLSNEGSSNDVDGTWGQYTIQEGENDLFLLNRRNGKKYRFMLEEV